MSRPYRHVRPGGSYFEITTRALQSRFLIPTGAHFRSVAIGIMARAKELYPVELYAFGGLSNHIHMLLGATDVDRLAGFVGYVKSNMAREAMRTPRGAQRPSAAGRQSDPQAAPTHPS